MTNLIGVLDCNNFFVSCERLFRPDLRGKPVVVLSSNDGCVVARSQEIKDSGVPMGVPYFQIKDTLKKLGATTFSSHFALYRDISRRVFAVMRAELGAVEQYSIDEGFFTVSADPEAVAWRLKQAVERQVGIPVSVGIAATKTLAKYANDTAKKGAGVCVLDERSWPVQAEQVPLPAIWGVGGKLAVRYRREQLLTVADLLRADPARIERLFGVSGMRLRYELQGVSVHTVAQHRDPAQSMMSSRSFPTAVFDQATLADAVAYHARHLAADLRASGQVAGVLSVSLYPSRHGDFILRGGTKETVFTLPTNDTLALVPAATALCQALYEPKVPYKKAGVGVYSLGSATTQQASLFASEVGERREQVNAAIDEVNRRAGREAIVVGSRLRTKTWSPRTGAISPSYTTKWSDIAIAQAG